MVFLIYAEEYADNTASGNKFTGIKNELIAKKYFYKFRYFTIKF